MREPYPYEPNWTLTLGGQEVAGCGLLPPPVFARRESIDRFTVFFDPDPVSWTLTVLPRQGKILLDSTVAYQFPEGFESPQLVWFRRMHFQMHTHDHFTGAPECSFYGCGLEARVNGREVKAGFRITQYGLEGELS